VTRSGRLVRKYAVIFVTLVSGALLTSGAVETYFSYQENKAALAAIQKEKAVGAAASIEGFVKEIERQMGWTTQLQLVAPGAALEQRRIDYLRLLRQVLPITELSHLDASGKEQLRVSRLAMDLVGSQTDYSHDPRFVEPRKGHTWFGPVYFRKESEPYMTIAMPQSGGGGITVAEVNLKFIWDVVSQIKIGKAGRAWVVDGAGNLIAHPDISLVLQKTSMARLEQVQAALARRAAAPATGEEVIIARDLQQHRVLTAFSPIPTLGWTVFAEQPIEEAFAQLYASIQRTVGLEVFGIVLSVVASLFLARRMVRPIRALQEGAARIGAGELGQRIAVHTGDELEALAAEFNRMASQLQDSYATLEQKVDERTRALSESLDQQTATAEILSVISSSPTDVLPVFDTITKRAARLCEADYAGVMLVDGEVLRSPAHYRGFNMTGEQAVLMDRIGPIRISPALAVGRAVLHRRVEHLHDVLDHPAHPVRDAARGALGYRTFLAVPLLREDRAIGVMVLWRREVRPFTDAQIDLLKTFADQAVIAIENVRLFTELRERTEALGRSVEQLTALGDVSRAVSSTLDLDAVLDAIVARASQLAGAEGCSICEYDEDTESFRVISTRTIGDELVEAQRLTMIRRGEGALGRIVETHEPVQIPDIEQEGAYRSPFKDVLTRLGYRAVLALPLLREAHLVGGLVVTRRRAGEFPPETVELLKTFATHAVLAIQNARLFRELEDKSRQLEVANRHKSEFLANMSHELRTPLNAIIGFSEMLVERMLGDLTPKQEEYLGDIHSSGRHLLALINDILDLSKVEAGRMELELAPFDLPEAIQNAMTLVRGRAEAHGIRLTVDVDGRLGEVVGDERKLKQILVNLLSNAVKFTPEGGQVTVRAVPADGSVEVSVADTGIGIAPEDQAAVFEEFRQVGTDAARRREGTGLGLALTRKLVELHGGHLWLKSEVGLGSTFTFTLPVGAWRTSSS
jgi:signal transduction histidine kinase